MAAVDIPLRQQLLGFCRSFIAGDLQASHLNVLLRSMPENTFKDVDALQGLIEYARSSKQLTSEQIVEIAFGGIVQAPNIPQPDEFPCVCEMCGFAQVGGKARAPVVAAAPQVVYRKHDVVVYVPTGERVTIVGVHWDNRPDVYYTVSFADKREKQTLPERLTAVS